MKNIRYLITIIFLFLCNFSYSNPVDSTLAKKVAKNYFEFLNPSRTIIEIKNTITIYYNGYPSYYIINFNEGGYIAVSANDATVPILMYSYDGEYIENGFHNPAYLAWMENYSKEIDSVRIYNIPNDSTIQEWNNILNKNFSKYKSTISVQPLLTTKWGQTCNNDGGYPGYNYFCPTTSNDCSDHRCSAGCGPIAMAQVMKYWMHPIHSTYKDYDWCNMPDSLKDYSTMTEVKAVARLIRDCGDRAGVNYCVAEWAGGCETSLWPIEKAKNALVDNFGYSDDIDLIVRKWHMKKWKGILRNELNNLRPIFYSGCKSIFPNECHSFICDGYDYDNINNFHFNFGWNGSCDGFYYFFDSIVPSDIDYNQYQKAIINIKPGYITSCNTFIQISESFRNLFIPISNVLYWTPLAGTINTALPPNNVIIKNGETATYSAYNEINLNEGFTAEAGSNFTAEIVQCPLDCKYPPVYINTMSILSEYYNYDEVNNMIIDTLINSEITISPNPFTDFIEIKNNIIQIDKIEIINMHSKVVYEKNNIGNSIYLGFLENGIYLLKIYTSDNIYVKKIIKQ